MEKITGTPIVEAYGLTEASPGVCCNPLNIEAYSGGIGLPVPSTEVELRDADGKEVPIGQPGELWVRGPQVMKGYWNRPEETAKAIDARGFLETGDIAVMDEKGWLKLVDRKKIDCGIRFQCISERNRRSGGQQRQSLGSRLYRRGKRENR